MARKSRGRIVRAAEWKEGPMSWHIGNVLAKVEELLVNAEAVLASLPEEQRGQSKSLLQAARASHAELKELSSDLRDQDDIRL